MKLILKSKKIKSKKHTWNRASSNFAAMNGVSSLSWCKKCGEEAVSGSASSECIYYEHETLTEWDGDNIPIIGMKQKENAVQRVRKHMLRILRKYGVLDAREFQGSTTVTGDAFYGLKNENKIEVEDGKVKLKK